MGLFELLPVHGIILLEDEQLMSVYSLYGTSSYVTQAKETLRKSFESILFIYQSSLNAYYSFGVLRGNIELEESVNRSLTMWLQQDSVKWEDPVDDMTAVRRMRLCLYVMQDWGLQYRTVNFLCKYGGAAFTQWKLEAIPNMFRVKRRVHIRGKLSNKRSLKFFPHLMCAEQANVSAMCDFFEQLPLH